MNLDDGTFFGIRAPVAELFDLRAQAMSDDTATAILPWSERFLNAAGTISGPAIMALLDFTLALRGRYSQVAVRVADRKPSVSDLAKIISPRTLIVRASGWPPAPTATLTSMPSDGWYGCRVWASKPQADRPRIRPADAQAAAILPAIPIRRVLLLRTVCST